MAFVKEKILEENKELFDSFNLCYDGVKREVNKFTYWLVDKEREIYFIYLGGGALEHPYVYALIWKNRKVIITVESRSYKENVHWLIESIKASKSLEQDKKAIIEIIKEVVPITYGCEVIFEVFPEPVFVEEERLNGR